MSWIKAVPPKMMHDKLGIYNGSWQKEMDRCWINNELDICVCSRLIRTEFGNVEHVTITKGTGSSNGEGEIPWAMKQQIKNELFGENRFAIEIFPKQKNLVDVCDVYHLWVFDKRVDMPFGIARGEYQKAVNRGYQISEQDMALLQADYKRTGKL